MLDILTQLSETINGLTAKKRKNPFTTTPPGLELTTGHSIYSQMPHQCGIHPGGMDIDVLILHALLHYNTDSGLDDMNSLNNHW